MIREPFALKPSSPCLLELPGPCAHGQLGLWPGMPVPQQGASAPAAASTEKRLGIFETGPATIQGRFPDLDGSLLQACVMDNYVVKTNVTLPLYKNGVKMLSRHPLNQRAHDVVKETYVASILAKGNVVGVRGAPWALPGPTEGEHLLLSYGTLAEAVYEAHAREPTNPFVLHALKLGLPGATVFHPRTPPDVLSYMKSLHNEFHAGARTSFAELYNAVDEVEAAWSASKLEKGITARACPSSGEQTYEKQYWRFVSATFPKQFKNWHQWDNAKSFKRSMVKAELFDEYKRIVGSRCDFLSALLDTDAVISNNHAVACMMLANFANTLKAPLRAQ